MSVANELAEALMAVEDGSMPSKTTAHAAMLITSTLASAALGRGLNSSTIVRDLALDKGGKPVATVWYTGGAKLPPADASRVNAITSDAAASDDSDLRNMKHCGTPLVAASMALAEAEGRSGTELLTAIAVGYEAAGRINRCIPNFRKRNFHGSSVVIFGVTIAAARLLKLSPAQTAHALSIAAGTSGTLSKAADTSTMREFNGGQATFNGVNAALLARAGFEAETRILEIKGGFFETFGGVADGSQVAQGFLDGFGSAWDIDQYMAIKLVPGGHPYHSLAEASARVVADNGIQKQDIVRITFSRSDGRYMSGPVHPKDLNDMAHSPTYFVAAGVVDGGVTWQHVSNEKILDPIIHKVIDLVEPNYDLLPEAEKFLLGARVEITTKDGKTFGHTVYAPRGSTRGGITWEMVDEKYKALMPNSGLPQEAIDQSFERIKNLAGQSNLTDLFKLLA